MGIETALLIGTLVSAAGAVVGGIQARGAAEQQASDTRAEATRQANLRQQEREQQARAEARENIALEKRQKLSFLKSGVSLEGSPLLLLAETRRKGTENVAAILKTGQTEATSLLRAGTFQSNQLKSRGRQALIGGLTKGVGTAAGGFSGFSGFGGQISGGGGGSIGGSIGGDLLR